MSTKCGKPSCIKPANGLSLCRDCIRTLEISIVNVAAYYDDLETVRTGQSKFSVTIGTKTTSSATPLGMDARFAENGVGYKAQEFTKKAVTTWTKRLLKDEPGLTPPKADTVRAAAYVLQSHVKKIARLPWAPDMLSDFTHCEKSLQRVVDRPAEGWYAGICGSQVSPDRPHDANSCLCSCHAFGTLGWLAEQGNHDLCDIEGGCGLDEPVIPGERCNRALYASPGEPFVICRDCKARYPTKDRRDKLLNEARDHNLSIRLLARIVLSLGDIDSSEAKLENRISKWAERGSIKARSERVINGQPRPLYRVGDVLDLLFEDTPSAINRKSS